ncbi:MAG: CDP-alcohol phosphatidyltransferase family protein [Planctomycetes bacterium]|nr:CDP-alcohol phosphatidyltransferase family protein [Planctomycetota bacterium]
MLKTAADWITAARFLLALALFGILEWAAELPPTERAMPAWLAFWVFVVAALTDTIDGAVARRTGMSDFGRVADPFVDKVLVVGALVFLAAVKESATCVPPWAVVVIVAREFLVTGVRGYAESKGLAFPADSWGKTKMVLQCLTVGGAILILVIPSLGAQPGAFFEFLPWLTRALLGLTLLITVTSGAGYFLRAWRFFSTTAAARP